MKLIAVLNYQNKRKIRNLAVVISMNIQPKKHLIITEAAKNPQPINNLQMSNINNRKTQQHTKKLN